MTGAEAGVLAGGIVCAITTPFGLDEKPDIGGFQALVDLQVEAGIHGLFVGGTSGEAPLLTRGERRLVAEAVVEAAAGRVPLIVHCGAADTKTSEHLAKHAVAIGADAVAVVAPFFFRWGPDRLFEHFRDVAGAADGAPLYLYDNPERVGYSLGPDLVARLVAEVPNIIGIKDTGDSVARLSLYLSSIDPPPDVYTGNNSLVYPALKIGASGAVSALSNVVPELFVAIYNAVRAGEDERALRLQMLATRFQACFTGVPYVPGVKYLLARAGLDAGHHRRPHCALTPEQASSLDVAIAACEGLEEWLDRPAG